MTDEDETLGVGLGLAPVVAVECLASPVVDLTGGEQGGERRPDNTLVSSSVILLLLLRLQYNKVVYL